MNTKRFIVTLAVLSLLLAPTAAASRLSGGLVGDTFTQVLTDVEIGSARPDQPAQRFRVYVTYRKTPSGAQPLSETEVWYLDINGDSALDAGDTVLHTDIIDFGQ